MPAAIASMIGDEADWNMPICLARTRQKAHRSWWLSYAQFILACQALEVLIGLRRIDTMQVAPNDAGTINEKDHALLIAGLGTSIPPMAAAAMLLLYKFALFIGLGPLFIMCLIFEQTKSLFQRWLLYGIGTIFSMAALAFVSSPVLQLSARVAAALWSASIINTITGQGAEGFSTQALEQGGIGLLLTVLIISVPPMAAMFFQGTLGSFMPYAAVGANAAARPGPQGQPPGSYGFGGYGGSAASQPLGGAQTNTGQGSDAGAYANSNFGRLTDQASTVQADVTKTKI